MKKVFALILVLAMALSLWACSLFTANQAKDPLPRPGVTDEVPAEGTTPDTSGTTPAATEGTEATTPTEETTPSASTTAPTTAPTTKPTTPPTTKPTTPPATKPATPPATRPSSNAGQEVVEEPGDIGIPLG
jgi:cytoskeletal protein RodZ